MSLLRSTISDSRSSQSTRNSSDSVAGNFSHNSIGTSQAIKHHNTTAELKPDLSSTMDLEDSGHVVNNDPDGSTKQDKTVNKLTPTTGSSVEVITTEKYTSLEDEDSNSSTHKKNSIKDTYENNASVFNDHISSNDLQDDSVDSEFADFGSEDAQQLVNKQVDDNVFYGDRVDYDENDLPSSLQFTKPEKIQGNDEAVIPETDPVGLHHVEKKIENNNASIIEADRSIENAGSIELTPIKQKYSEFGKNYEDQNSRDKTIEGDYSGIKENADEKGKDVVAETNDVYGDDREYKYDNIVEKGIPEYENKINDREKIKSDRHKKKEQDIELSLLHQSKDTKYNKSDYYIDDKPAIKEGPVSEKIIKHPEQISALSRSITNINQDNKQLADKSLINKRAKNNIKGAEAAEQVSVIKNVTSEKNDYSNVQIIGTPELPVNRGKKSQQSHQQSKAQEMSSPEVRIGQVDVYIESTSRSDKKQRNMSDTSNSSLSSRLYLRRL